MALLINVRLEQLARSTEAKTKFKTISLSWSYQTAIIKLQEIFLCLTVYSWYYHPEHHP